MKRYSISTHYVISCRRACQPFNAQCRGVAKPLCFAETARVSLMACRFEWGVLHPSHPNFLRKSLCIKNFILNTFSFRFFCKLRLKSCIFILCFLRFFAYFQLFFSLSALPALHAGNPAFCFLAFFIFIVVFIKYFWIFIRYFLHSFTHAAS